MLKINNKKLKGFLLLWLGILIAVLAQITLLESRHGDLSTYFNVRLWVASLLNNTSPMLGVCLYGLAAIFFVLGLRSFDVPFASLPIHTCNETSSKPKFGFWATSIVVSGVIAAYASQASANDSFGYAFTLIWVLSIILLLVSVLIEIGWQFPSISVILTWLKAHRAELSIILSVVTTAFLIRFIDVELHPYSFINDEGQMGSGGGCILQGNCANFFSLGWAYQPRLAFFPYAINIALLGRTGMAVRLVSVITGTLSVLAVYLLAREVFDKKIAWLSSIILSILPVHIHFSRTGVDNIIDSLTAPLLLWLLFRGAKRGSRLSFLAAGIIAGLCLYTYPGSLLAVALGCGTIGYIALRTKDFFRAHLKDILVFLLAIVVVVLPIVGYYSSHSSDFLSRLKRESILQEAGIPAQSQATGLSVSEILTTQFAKSSLVFIAGDAPGNFFNSPKPYLPAAEAIIFMLGMMYVLWRIKDVRFTVLFVWFWAVIILGSTLTGGPPTSQRILMSMPALAIITALGLSGILEFLKQFYYPISKFFPIVLLGFMLYFGYENINFYFSEYRIGHYYEDPTNELTYETAAFISPLHEDGYMYLIANPDEPYLIFESFNYFSPDVEKYAVKELTKNDLANFPEDKDVLFIALPDYKSKLELISMWIPGSKLVEFTRRYQPEFVLFYSYKITKEQLAAFKP